ncbi:hypothetical protein CYY_007010 [Polysphondylium violaceum]|uniref:Uncharacterized protein n=1 Tax=Polysphondylium violaceum TaxID=133409 RepID=A0A8J4PR24_9MYCE|nr:hypothetical protein CYY_007010 [Polysphondylium violaceum]
MYQLNDPNNIPSIFKGLKIIGPAVDDIPMFKQTHANFDANGVPAIFTPVSCPVLSTTANVKNIYQNLDFPNIRYLENAASDDLTWLLEDFKKRGLECFQKVELDGKKFLAAWHRGGIIWCCAEFKDIKSDDPNYKYEATAVFGTFSQNAMIAGIQSYNLKLPNLLIEGVIASLLVRVFASYVAEGLSFVASAIAARLATFLATWGIELAFTVPEFVLPLVAACIVFTIVFIGLEYLWNFLNRQYTQRVQFFNWDTTQQWVVDGQYSDNAVIAGHDDGVLKFAIPKMLLPGQTVIPPGFSGPITSLDTVCFYGEAIWQNYSTFLQGNAMACRVRRDDSQDGFTWVFNNPRFNSNQQTILNGAMDPKDAYNLVFNNNLWDQNPTSSQKMCSNTRNYITYGMDYLSNAPKDVYNVVINIGPPNPANTNSKL